MLHAGVREAHRNRGMTLTLLSLSRATLMAFPALGIACGALPRFSAEQVACRGAVNPEGDRVAAGIEWHHIDDARDRQFQNAWCVGVGPAVVWDAPLPVGEELVDAEPATRTSAGDATPPTAGIRTSAEPVLDSLLVVAYNAHIGEGDLVRLVGDIRQGRLTGAPVTHFVLLLQEVHREGLGVPPDDELPEGTPSGSRTPNPERVDIIEWAQALALNLFYAPSMRNGIGFETPEDRGNAILSTLPLKEPKALELPAGIQRRVTLVANVRGRTSAGSAWTLGVSTAHLDNAALTSPLASLGSARARQASGLVRMLPVEGPLVVGGDFNTWFQQTEERAYRIMRDDFPYPLTPQSSPTAQRLGAGRIIDWMFFRGPRGWSFDDARAPRMYGSDHYPVYGWVRIPPGGYEG